MFFHLECLDHLRACTAGGPLPFFYGVFDQSRHDLGHNIGDSIFAGKHLLQLPGPLAEAGDVGNGPHADRQGSTPGGLISEEGHLRRGQAMAQGGRELWGHSTRTYTEAGSAVRGTMHPQPGDR